MKKLLSLLGTIVMLISCDRYFNYFDFVNNSGDYIYIIIDTNTSDDIISVGSICESIFPYKTKRVETKEPWNTIVKDSIYVYVIDGSLIDLPIDNLSLENAERITPEMVLARKTMYHPQSCNGPTLCFP